MRESRRASPEAWILVAAGLAWLFFARGFGLPGFLFAAVPGSLLLTSGLSDLLYAGDRRITQFAALGGALGVPFALPALWVAGAATGLALIALSLASFVAAGVIAAREDVYPPDAPTPALSPRLGAEVAVDDLVLSDLTLRAPVALEGEHARIRAETHEARALLADRGWLADPRAYHRSPEAPPRADLRRRRAAGADYEHLRFESGYEPWPDEPGRDRWLGYGANRTAHAWILRHREPAPWLVCIHGYGMGEPWMDLRAFDAARLHHLLGLNLALPVLPLHGPRRRGGRSGDGFIAADFLDTLHAEAQALWDLRRLLRWIESQPDPARFSVYGLSLGGYNAALLSSFEDAAAVLAGIPACDLTQLTWRHGSALQIRFAERQGLVHDEVAELLRPVSPLAFEPRPPRERRAIFAAVTDRIVPAWQPHALWRHWEEPRIAWYAGGHLSFRLHRPVRALIGEFERSVAASAAGDAAGELAQPAR